jgi:hypothetical protein
MKKISIALLIVLVANTFLFSQSIFFEVVGDDSEANDLLDTLVYRSLSRSRSYSISDDYYDSDIQVEITLVPLSSGSRQTGYFSYWHLTALVVARNTDVILPVYIYNSWATSGSDDLLFIKDAIVEEIDAVFTVEPYATYLQILSELRP